MKSSCFQYSKGISQALVIFLAVIVPAAGRDWDSKIEAACPAAIEEEARLLAARPTPKDADSLSRPALRKELLQMEKLDQDAREVLIAATGHIPTDDPALLHMRGVDAINLQKLKHIINQDGFPTLEMVGLGGVQAAFVLTQHADSDPQFQAKMLRVFTARLKDGEILGQDYGLLTDRVLRAQGKPQRYGTQFSGGEEGWKPDPIADEAHVDERRSGLGMISLANYSCMLRAMYDSPTLP